MKNDVFKIKWLSIFILMWGMSLTLFAQQRLVTGVVIESQTNEPIPGTTVIIKGTQRGAVSASDGTFSINVTNADTLLVSSVGFENQVVPVGNRMHITVMLKPQVISFQEIVVIGYGQVRREDATGAIVSVSTKDFNRGAITSPQELISGKVSGVQITTSGGAPGGGATIRIRGGSSLSASNDPLFVIDGVPVDNDGVSGMRNPMSTINPNDIESFTILKDASATAIYGSRASNGVIIITTKTGAKGALKFNYDGNFSVGTKTNQIDVLNADEYKSLIYSRYGESSGAAALLGNSRTNWQDQIFQTAIGHDHNFSMMGAAKNTPFRLSLGYSNQTGLLKT